MASAATTTLGEIASLLGYPAPAAGLAQRAVKGMATLGEAGPEELSFLGSDQYLKDFETTRALAVIVQKRVKLTEPARARTPTFVVDDADLAVAKVLELF